jgi:ssRNA-specific RNase YbeY (16S rRNA maturation enzyme)
MVTPGTTDRLCAPLQTRGEVSCQTGDRVVLNAKRWQLSAKSYGTDLANYRRYLVNHEFGHYIGYGHVNCPGRGQLAPIMLQQTKGLDGCRKNPWVQSD